MTNLEFNSIIECSNSKSITPVLHSPAEDPAFVGVDIS